MAETQNVTTVEINDAIFCTHFKEIVRSDAHNHKMSPEYLLIAYSVPIVTSMEEKRMIRSSGWVYPSYKHMAARVLMKPSFPYLNSLRISLV